MKNNIVRYTEMWTWRLTLSKLKIVYLYKYKQCSLECNWSFFNIEYFKVSLLVDLRKIKRAVSSNLKKYKQKFLRYKRAQAILFRLALIKLKYLKVWPFSNYFIFVYPLGYKEKFLRYKQSINKLRYLFLIWIKPGARFTWDNNKKLRIIHFTFCI